MKKDLSIIFGLVALVVVLVIFGRGFTSPSFFTSLDQGQGQVSSGDVIDVSTKSLNVKSRIVSKPSDRKKGLSGLDSLALDQGMFFVFEVPGDYGFWMKDMKFAIDIIWISENKEIVDLAVNVPPEPKRKDKELTVYKPKAKALYVLEINAGLAQLHNLKVGDTVNFDL